jgi:hypothetical protein
MLESIREFQAAVVTLEKTLSKVRTPTLTRQDLLNTVRSLVDGYFRAIREAAVGLGIPESALASVDADMQMLLDSTHRRTRISVYKNLLKSAKKGLVDVEKRTLMSGPLKHAPMNSVDVQILQTLRQLVPSAALSYEQGIADLAGPERSSWRGPATDLREALREALDKLAPDKEVQSQTGFRFEANRTEPTMKQKVRFVLRQRGRSSSAVESSEASVEAVEAALATFVRSTYRRSNVSTHTPTNRSEVLRVRDFVRISLCELLEISEP